MLHAVVMAGGSGTRFWPASRRHLPKQLLKLTGDRSLLQEAVARLEGVVPLDRVWVITNREQAPASAAQLPHLAGQRIVAEPCARDTAACVGLGATLILQQDPEAVMVVTPADHVIQPTDRFHHAIRVAAGIIEQMPSSFVTFGIKPTFPSTGYGYIRRGQPLRDEAGVPVYRVLAFREKPNRERAEEFLQTGQYYWNSGIFVWRARAILEAIAQHAPKLSAALRRIAAALDTPRAETVLAQEYEGLPKISIDYAVMEHATEVCVVEAPFQWDDVGSWSALARLLPKDPQHNAVVGRHGGLETHNCLIFTSPDHLVATLGTSDLIIVHSPDATLVANRRDDEAIKRLVDWLARQGFDEYL